MTEEIYAVKCIKCGRSALFDGVLLEGVNPEDVQGVWHCSTPCDGRKKKKKLRASPISQISKNSVRVDEVWTNSLLERLSTQLSTRTSNLEQEGDSGNTECPTHYCYDLMIPLAIASLEEPLGWMLFGSKYLHDAGCIKQMVEHVTVEVSKYKYMKALSALVVRCYCSGRRISGRQLRRDLGVGRGEGREYQVVNDLLQSHFHMVEENYARIVKIYL